MKRSWSRVVGAVAVAAMVAAAMLAAAGPAQAYTCSGGRTISVVGACSWSCSSYTRGYLHA